MSFQDYDRWKLRSDFDDKPSEEDTEEQDDGEPYYDVSDCVPLLCFVREIEEWEYEENLGPCCVCEDDKPAVMKFKGLPLCMECARRTPPPEK